MKLVMASISSRSEGTSSRSTSEKNARHLLRHLAAEAVCLHEIHRGQKPRLAEDVGPRVGHLRLNSSTLWLRVSSSKAAPASAKRIRLSES